MNTVTSPRGAHLVGSVPLDNAEQVFRTVGSALGEHVRRSPDGETGDRQQWVQFQLGVLGARPQFHLIDNTAQGFENLPPTLVLRPGIGAHDFGGLGYSAVALESFETFTRLKAEGSSPRACAFSSACRPRSRTPRPGCSSTPSSPSYTSATRRRCSTSSTPCWRPFHIIAWQSNGTSASRCSCSRNGCRCPPAWTVPPSPPIWRASPTPSPQTSSWATTSASATSGTPTSRSPRTPGASSSSLILHRSGRATRPVDAHAGADRTRR